VSVADNARDAVIFHVSASSQRQELGKETDAMTKTIGQRLLEPSVLCFYSIGNLVVQVT
jgi:hypothetical protein